MHDSLSLQRSLYRTQKALISRAVESGSPSFRAYEARYQRRTRTFERAVTSAQVAAEVRAADLIYVGDYHTLPSAQQAFARLLRAALEDGRRTVLALEFVEGRHQKSLDAYLAGGLAEREFLARIGHPYTRAFDIWPAFRPILDLARAHALEVRAVDLRAAGPGALARRDAYAAARIADAFAAPDRPRVLALVGQYHVAPCHLPAAVEARLPGAGRRGRRSLVVYQNCESIWWALAREGRASSVEAVRIREGEVCLVHTSPLLCQQSFLDYLEAESDDAPLGADGAQERFRQMATLVGRFAGVDVRRQLSRALVLTAGDADALERIRRRGGLTPKEVAELRRQMFARESCYVPRARTAYLASLSLNHAAEEAAHFVRHCAVREAMERPRRLADAFYARCVEEAIGFLGSRLVNPRRRCQTLADWSRAFASRRGEDRQIAAFVLAHAAAEEDGPDQACRLLPLRRDRLFHAVSHGLGYRLGDALHAALEAGRLGRADVRELFRDPLGDPRAAYFAWLARAR